jgi:hypothetical protein
LRLKFNAAIINTLLKQQIYSWCVNISITIIMWITTKRAFEYKKTKIKNTFCSYTIGIIFETIKKVRFKIQIPTP